MKIFDWILRKLRERKIKQERDAYTRKTIEERGKEMLKKEKEAEEKGLPNPWLQPEEGDETILFN